MLLCSEPGRCTGFRPGNPAQPFHRTEWHGKEKPLQARRTDIAGGIRFTKEAAMATELSHSTQEPDKRLAQYSLLEALLARRSRRFGRGMRLNGGPLAYESVHEPAPLSLAEEATLAFAASGITGYTMA